MPDGDTLIGLGIKTYFEHRRQKLVFVSAKSTSTLYGRNLFEDLVHGLDVHSLVTHRPLSRRLDRCDRVIHNESGDPNGGNMCSFSGATCTSRVRHNADYVPYAKIRFDL